MATKASDTLLGQVNAFRYAVEPIPGGHTFRLALSPGPTQLFVACSTEK